MILSLAYNEPIQRPASSWLVSSIQVKALHRYRSQVFDSLTSRFFFRLSFRNCKSCVYNLRWSVLFHIIFTHLRPSAEDTSGEAGHFFFFFFFFTETGNRAWKASATHPGYHESKINSLCNFKIWKNLKFCMENALIQGKKILSSYDRQKIPYIVQMVISSSEIG